MSFVMLGSPFGRSVSYRGASQEATTRIRDAIRQRYILLPYIYTLFRHANTSGLPVMRPLWFDFPEERATFAVDDEFMLGPGLLVGHPDTLLAHFLSRRASLVAS